MSITIQGLTKRFRTFTAVNGVDLTVGTGELVALLGPSGSGKTTLLRIIAGLEFADSGSVLFEERDATMLDARDRQVGFVFQHYALFRHMTVFENVAFGLRVMPRHRRPANADIRARVTRLLELVQLAAFAERFPSQLSGGQRQRVALARALAIEPKVLLLDEPFGALDATVRKELRRWLRRLHDEIAVTSVFVTHDQEEALEVADRVVVMNKGQIEQIGTPTAIHDYPATPFVYEFLGHANRFTASIEGGMVRVGGFTRNLEQSGLTPAAAQATGTPIAYVRPHEMDIVPPDTADAAAVLTVRHTMARGGLMRVELVPDSGSDVFEIEAARHDLEAMGVATGVRVGVRPAAWRVFVR
jgi:sulfate/thiosulfate transport system ATP-binding protein